MKSCVDCRLPARTYPTGTYAFCVQHSRKHKPFRCGRAREPPDGPAGREPGLCSAAITANISRRKNNLPRFPWGSRTENQMLLQSFSNRLALVVFLFLVTNSPAWS